MPVKIKPFKALIYNPEKIKSVSEVVCPPYDVISSVQQQYYHELHPYNFIHILLAKDIPGEDKYRRAGVYLRDWVKNKILIQDDAPAIYFYNQEYNLKGEKKSRLGFIALLHLGDANSSVFGHERTRLAPKEDRLRLLKAVKANLSPIFAVFSDKERIIQRTYQSYLKDKKPFIDIVDDNKIHHSLWRLNSENILSKIQMNVENKNIFIADGHHRYEVACAYRDQMQKRLPVITGEENFNYLLAYFTNSESHDLTILPIHRLVKLAHNIDMDTFRLSLSDYFDLEEVRERTKFFFLMEKGGRTEHLLGMYKDKKYWLLRLKNIKLLDKIINDKPKEYRLLDVAILNHLILKKILRLDWEDNKNITFSNDANELLKQVDSDRAYIAFFLNPAKMQQVAVVALHGYKMPAKSTYFYPKVLSGLVINKFNEDKR